MTATVREFCRKYGIDEKSEELVNEIYEALCGKIVSLAIKGKKAKLQFPTAVRERLIEECSTQRTSKAS